MENTDVQRHSVNHSNENGGVPVEHNNNTGMEQQSGADQARRILERLGVKFFSRNGSTLLHQCVGKPPAFVYVLANGGVPVNIQNSDGDTALHLAVRGGNYGVSQALLQCSADLTMRNKMGQTALDVAEGPLRDLLLRYQPGVVQAVLHGRSQVLDRLCKHTWCNVDTVVKEGKTLMELAVSRAETDDNVRNCCRILHNYHSTSDIVHAVLSEDEDRLRSLLESSRSCFVNVRYRDKQGSTLLSHAIETDNLTIARILVQSGCRVNKIRIRENDMLTTTVPLCFKALQKHVSLDMVKFIFTIQDATEFTEKDGEGNTFILRAIEEELSDDVIQWLITFDRGRCLVHRNQHGATPRELALQRGLGGVVKIIDNFIQQQGRAFSQLYQPIHFSGNTTTQQIGNDGEDEGSICAGIENRGVSLFEAASRGDLVQVQTLNDAAYVDKNGYTALTRAVVFNQLEVIKYLCTSRPELKTTGDSCNRYPLHYACALPDEQSHTICKILLERNPEDIETRQDKDGRYPAEYKQLRRGEELKWMLYNARTLDAYAQRGPPLSDWPPEAEMSPPHRRQTGQ